jgi:hypothetical protein
MDPTTSFSRPIACFVDQPSSAMKTRLLFGALLVSTTPVLASGLRAAGDVQPPPPQVLGRSLPEAPARLVENQRIYGPDAARPLIAPEVAKGLVERFRTTYSSPAAPRLVLYVNRELVGDGAAMKLTGHTENYTRTEQAGVDTALKTRGTNTYAVGTDAAPPSLADRQTVREIERLFGRVFRNADARLADQATAVALLPDEPGRSLAGSRAAKDREALAKVADIAVEVLITSRNLPVTMVSGDQLVPVPDIQVTAIRLKDAAIVGQASAADVLGKGADAGRKARQYDIQEITEATALALMEDMLLGAK